MGKERDRVGGFRRGGVGAGGAGGDRARAAYLASCAMSRYPPCASHLEEKVVILAL